jgi:hypothetical protein
MSTSTIANFTQEQLNNAMVEYTPAVVSVDGKTASDKRLSVVAKGSESTQLFAVTMGGKVGKAARSNILDSVTDKIAIQTARNNYRPLAEAMALVLGEPVSVTVKAHHNTVLPMLIDRYEPMLTQLETSGKMYSATGKLSAKAKMYCDVIGLIREVSEKAVVIEVQQRMRDQGAE